MPSTFKDKDAFLDILTIKARAMAICPRGGVLFFFVAVSIYESTMTKWMNGCILVF
jgi:hypothetical protein